ncbi:MAG: hypothetical protein DWI57_18745 [Chloroflexi bacterium]|nr:MAG: hypothetical protein DWI57_18745 [Chloroflexota bacterium]
MSEIGKYARTLAIQEGWLCLDFANTAEWHASDQPSEQLESYTELVEWAQGRGLLRPDEAEGLLRLAGQRAEQATAVLGKAIDLRETIYRIFSAHAQGEPGAPADLDELNRSLAAGAEHFRIVPGQTGYVWDWQAAEGALDPMLWAVARSAAELLTSEDLARVGQCADDRGCGWLFLDSSRNHSRRWCFMENCGNRAKARSHYERKHKEFE